MSGGVDSSVAAALLKRDGWDVVGVFMRLGSPGETLDTLIPGEQACDSSRARIGKQGCCSVGDAADARLVAAELGIPFYVCNFKREFGRIIDYFVEEYAEGRTPNPCVRCNDWLKFGRLFDQAAQIGADAVCSGHYARVRDHDDAPRLLRGVDRAKDQSYVLFGVPRERLGRVRLPIGEMEKRDVRARAEELGLPVFEKPDSQEICFVPDNDYAGLLERRRPDLGGDGEIVDSEGRVVGRHPGHHRFTLGQRRGLNLALGYPVYVVDKDPTRNRVIVGERADLGAAGLEAGGVNWISDPRAHGEGVEVQVRSHAAPARAAIDLDAAADRLSVRFERAQRAVTPGQACVCYAGDRVLGGGWIRSIERASLEERASAGV